MQHDVYEISITPVWCIIQVQFNDLLWRSCSGFVWSRFNGLVWVEVLWPCLIQIWWTLTFHTKEQRGGSRKSLTCVASHKIRTILLQGVFVANSVDFSTDLGVDLGIWYFSKLSCFETSTLQHFVFVFTEMSIQNFKLHSFSWRAGIWRNCQTFSLS